MRDRAQSWAEVSQSRREMGLQRDSCRNCGLDGHWARQCKKCFRWGSSQQVKKDCPFWNWRRMTLRWPHFRPPVNWPWWACREKKTTKTQFLNAILLIHGESYCSVVSSGGSVSWVTCNFLQSLGFSNALEVYKGKNLIANCTSKPLKVKAEIRSQLEKFTVEFRIVFHFIVCCGWSFGAARIEFCMLRNKKFSVGKNTEGSDCIHDQTVMSQLTWH